MMSDENKVAHKLHSQFLHPTAEKLIKLVNSAGLSDDQKDQICEVSKNCEICQVYKRPGPRPVIGLPLATEQTLFTSLHETEAGTACYHITLKFERHDESSLQIATQENVLKCTSLY